MRVFPDDAGFCPADGAALQSASQVPVANTAEDPRLGTRLCGRYELRRTVAEGGMGRVYEAIDRQNNTRVAVKVLHDDVAKDDVSLERFKREYEISSQLPHDYIVKVLDFQRDESSNVWLLVMEFLEGEELRFVLKREKVISPDRFIRMLSQVAVGLDEAHARQFVHRDLKPDNLFLCGTRDGDNVKILDFGSVKDKNKDAKKLTVLGTTIGSPFYMAPEQAQGLDTLDARADVFALAAITYECVTGSVPFTGNNGPSILLAILTKDPDPPSTKAGKFPIPTAVDDVLEVALAKNPNIRTKSVGELATAVGHAYGLEGDHHAWARMTQAELGHLVAEGRNKGKPVLEASADPFAAPPKTSTAPMPARPMSGAAPPAVAPSQASAGSNRPPAMNHANRPPAPAAIAHVADVADVPIGVPSGRPAWLIPVVVGLALVVFGVVFALAR